MADKIYCLKCLFETNSRFIPVLKRVLEYPVKRVQGYFYVKDKFIYGLQYVNIG